MQGRSLKSTFATHFPSLSRALDINQNVYMFTQDVPLGVMPIGGRTQEDKHFSVTLEGDNSACERALRLLVEIGRHDRRDPKKIVCAAVHEIAQNLSWSGCAVFEIVKDDAGDPHMFAFTSNRLFRIASYFLQIIPRGDWDFWKKKFVLVPANRIWCVVIPPELGGKTGFKGVLRRLRRANYLGPKFWRKDLELGIQSKTFNFESHLRSNEVYVGRVTKIWGWGRRGSSQERSTAFFSFYRTLRFKWAQAVLRRHIVSELNRLFARLGMECSLRVTGLPTEEDILQINRELVEGRTSFGLALDRASF